MLGSFLTLFFIPRRFSLHLFFIYSRIRRSTAGLVAAPVSEIDLVDLRPAVGFYALGRLMGILEDNISIVGKSWPVSKSDTSMK